MSLSEDVIRQITERVTREVLAALDTTDDYPDWDEYAGTQVSVEESSPISDTSPTSEVSPPAEDSPIPRHSALRALAKGTGVIAVDTDGDEIRPDPDGIRGDVMPMGYQASRGSGFDPNSNPDWFVAQRQRDAAQRRMPAWEAVV